MMLLVTGTIAGLIAGIGMALVSEIMYRFKIFKSSQLIIDGAFVCKYAKLRCSPMMMECEYWYPGAALAKPS